VAPVVQVARLPLAIVAVVVPVVAAQAATFTSLLARSLERLKQTQLTSRVV
jgi:hypothetical protein